MFLEIISSNNFLINVVSPVAAVSIGGIAVATVIVSGSRIVHRILSGLCSKNLCGESG